jgi:hypothetical protein
MRNTQIFTLSITCRIISLLLVFITGCELYFGDVETDTPDATAVAPDAWRIDASTPIDAGRPDAAALDSCETACPGQEYTPWNDTAGNCMYVICRPSYDHCACPPPVTPTCASLGCDGTQEAPLVCPDDGGPCFCSSSIGQDGLCIDPPLVEAFLFTGEVNSASVNFKVNCPQGSTDGPHQGAVELYAAYGLVGIKTFTWTCSESEHMLTWANLPCGTDIWARAVALHPTTGEPTYLLTVHSSTAPCNL